jgi:hypothetical protein
MARYYLYRAIDSLGKLEVFDSKAINKILDQTIEHRTNHYPNNKPDATRSQFPPDQIADSFYQSFASGAYVPVL